MILLVYPDKRELAPGWWAPVRPDPASIAARARARVHCADRGHRWYPATVEDPAFCVWCGRARRLVDRWMGR